jgi:hypothetical protein
MCSARPNVPFLPIIKTVCVRSVLILKVFFFVGCVDEPAISLPPPLAAAQVVPCGACCVYDFM